MNEHDGVAHCAALFQGVTELHIVVVLQTHAAEDNDIDLSLHRDPGQKLVVRLAGDREDRKLLALYQRIEYVDHRDTGTDHLRGKDTLCRVERRTADGDHVLRKCRTVVSRNACTVEDTAEQVIGERDHHRPAEEADRIRRADALCACKYLQGYDVFVQLDDICVAVAHQRQVTVSDARGTYGNDVTDDRFYFCIYFLHIARTPLVNCS